MSGFYTAGPAGDLPKGDRTGVETDRQLRPVHEWCAAVSVVDEPFYQFDHFQIFDLVAIDGKPHDGAHHMKPMLSCSAGIDVKHLKFGVKDHLQDMGVARR